ncbi:DUF6970 domain-containing protein [Piscinibacter terrae]|uniref:DUF6970 domain-containing protein n=1 Tax=Piscinibacter terrae TaxID=2496871 RepID=A0A3N7JXG5_9BURK|nr:hypothetical protein [Albitalea terrae]RQP25529.1 hypothetical protein DZC73_00120 [Albitalea terrae]
MNLPIRSQIVALALLMSASAFAQDRVPRDGLPSWLVSKMKRYDGLPEEQAPLGIWQITREGQPAYLEIAPCCDQYNPLFDAKGQRICAPTGGFHGGGDMKCPNPADPRTKVRLVWVHPKSADQNPPAPQLSKE